MAISPRTWAQPKELRGEHATLLPTLPAHIPALHAVSPQETFRYFLDAPRSASPDDFRTFIETGLADDARAAFTVVDNSTGTICGSTSYLDVRPAHRGLEIGATWYGQAWRGTMVNPESKLLLLRHAFEQLGCARVQLKCDARNERSQRAIAALGAVREGVLRRHMTMPDGYQRDTVMFSIVDDEWPAVRAKLLARIGRGSI
jgi:RimJ/RimL family protein N-acetyltransferase